MNLKFVLSQKYQDVFKRLNITTSYAEQQQVKKMLPNYNIYKGQQAMIVTSQTNEIRFFKYGLTPFWAKNEFNLTTARTEGMHNMENSPSYKGAKGIIKSPAFRKPIRSQRCLVFANAYIQGLDSIYSQSLPNVVYLKNRKIFCFAGLWDTWFDQEKKQYIDSFCIVTTVANNLLKNFGSERMPVILSQYNERKWLKSKSLSEVTALLKPYPSNEISLYPVSKEILKSNKNDRNLLLPYYKDPLQIAAEPEQKLVKKINQKHYYYN